MGFRGHARKINKIEYGTSAANWKFDEFESFFTEYDNVFPKDKLYFLNEFGSHTWEFYKETFASMVTNLTNALPETKECFGAIINSESQFASHDEAFNYALECLQTWLAESDPNNEYIVIDWF